VLIELIPKLGGGRFLAIARGGGKCAAAPLSGNLACREAPSYSTKRKGEIVMFRESAISRVYHGVCFFILFFIAAAASFGAFYAKWHFHEAGVAGADDYTQFEGMVDGTAHRPFVYRQMLPAVANWADRVVPQARKTHLYNRQTDFSKAFTYAITCSPTARSQVYFFRYFVVYVTTFLSALLAVFAMYLVCAALEFPAPVAVLAPVIVILLVPYIQTGGGYFYDYPELAFFALAVWVALKFDWWWVIPVAALGAWNKESFLLFIPTLYPIFRRRSSRLGAVVGIGVLCLVCLAVYYPIRLRFAGNPGSTVMLGLSDQRYYFTHPRELLFSTEETYGLRMLAAYTLVPIAFGIWTVCRGWRQLPLVMRRHGQIAAAINFPLYFLFCSGGELRDLSLLYIVFLLVLAVDLNAWIGDSMRAGALQTGYGCSPIAVERSRVG
jgi:hypothetical protein